MSHPPSVAAALLAGGAVHTHTSVKGDVEPALHPLVARFVEDLLAEQRERFTGRCAELVLVSDRLYAASPGELTAGEARAALWGARITATRIREHGDPAHGTVQPPCRSCAALLDWFGIEPVATPDDDTPPTDASDLAEVLAAAGRDPDHRDEDQARAWGRRIVQELSSGGNRHAFHPAALTALAELGGLATTLEGPGEDIARSGFTLDPLLALHTVDTLAAFGKRIDAAVAPLGVDAAGLLAIDDRGWVFALDHGGDWFLGDTLDAALTTLVAGQQPARVRDDGTW